MTELDNLFKNKIKEQTDRLFEITSDHGATIRQVLHRLDKQECQQLKVFRKQKKYSYLMKKNSTLKNDIERLSNMIGNQDEILNGYKEVYQSLNEEVTLIKLNF